MQLAVDAVAERHLESADEGEHLLRQPEVAAVEHHGTAGVAIASRNVLAHSVSRESVLEVLEFHIV